MPTVSAIPPREDIPDNYQWQLTDIYDNDSLWQLDFTAIKELLPQIAQYRGKLAQQSENLLACLKLRDKIGITTGKLMGYARMHRDENSANNQYQALTSKIEGLLAETGGAMAFIEPEIIAMPDETLAQFRQHTSGLAEYSFYLENLLRQKQHVLSPAVEEVLSHSLEVTQAPENIFNMLAHADIKFGQIANEHGEQVQLSEGRYHSFIISPNRKVRQQAFETLFTTYNQYRNTFAATLIGNLKKNIFYAKTRKYPSTIESALADDNIALTVYDNLLTTIQKNLDPLHRYVAMKKRCLKLPEIHMYDLYTPVVTAQQPEYSYEEGLQLVQTALAPLGSEYAEILRQGLSSGWIDVYENQGKQTGAYSWGIYGVHPFVLLNYADRYSDVSTLAHEMGHAIHSYYSHSHQPYATASYTTFSAEVASTTNEILLLEYMLANTDDVKARLLLINQYLETVRTTVYRQTLFAEFEKVIYEQVEKGESLTADSLSSIWHDFNIKYYGTAIIVDQAVDIEWARIPHFYWSFYVFQYVTGYAAATALAQQILTEGQPAQQRYLRFLQSGGSNYSINLLQQAGVDMTTPAPIEVTLHKFAAKLDELERLMAQVTD